MGSMPSWWCDKLGCNYSKRLRLCRGPVGDTWHLDEEYLLKTNGQFQYLWCAVDQEGQVIDILA
jgi:putative transposase